MKNIFSVKELYPAPGWGCNYSPECGGYTVSGGHFQLKDEHCKNNLSYVEGTTTYIKIFV